MWKRRLAALIVGAAVVAGLVLLRAADPYAVQVARETTFDIYQQIKPREAPPDIPVRILDIDEVSLAEVGQWPWSRRTMAEVADRLTELGAAAVVFDLLFVEPDRLDSDADATFAAALKRGPSILAMSRNGAGSTAPPAKTGFAVVGSDPLGELPPLGGVAAPLPVLGEAAAGLGVASLDRSGAGVARRLPLLWESDGTPMPALSLEAIRVAQAISTVVVLGDEASTVQGVRVGAFEIPTGPSGDMWLYYRPLGPESSVSAGQLLGDGYSDLAPLLSGHIVLVGTSAAGLLDMRASALGDAVPGVSIHLQAIEQMLTGSFLHRADWVGGLELLAMTASGMAVVLVLLLTGPLVGLIFSIMIAAMATAVSWFAFAHYGVLLDPSYTLFGTLVTYAAMAFFQFAVTDADKRRIRRAFAHYVEPALLTQIEANADKLKLGGDVRELTVMFSDVRSFTAISERSQPTELVAMLNRLFAVLGAAIVGQHGTIDKFMGDAVMAFWNAPVDVPRHAHHACLAALDMREALRRLNAENPGNAPIVIGIGLATGPALVGNMGFETRFDYSCIGETVNRASRLEGACKQVGYDILVTTETRDAAPELAFLAAGALALKGISQPGAVHLLVGREAVAQSQVFLTLASLHNDLLTQLAAGQGGTDSLERCRMTAMKVNPGLVGFYDAIVSRQADFHPLASVKDPA